MTHPTPQQKELPIQHFNIGDWAQRKQSAGANGYPVGLEPFQVISIDHTGWVFDHTSWSHNPQNIILVARAGSEHAAKLLQGESTALAEPEPEPAAEDVVNHPSHYMQGGLEAIDVIEAFGLDRDFRLGNAAKYLLRAGKKDDEVQDLKKAVWYLNRYIQKAEAQIESTK